MKIKSDTKQRKSLNLDRYKGVFKDFETFHQSWIGTIIIYLLLTFSAYFLWENHALYAIIFHLVSGVFIAYRNEYMTSKIFMSIILVGATMIFATANLFVMEDHKVVKNVKYEKIEFIDSTEKVIVKATSPINKTIVFDRIQTNEYFSIRNANDINVSITYRPISDYYDKKKDIISEHNYFYTIKYGSETYTTNTFEESEPLF